MEILNFFGRIRERSKQAFRGIAERVSPKRKKINAIGSELAKIFENLVPNAGKIRR